MTDDASRYDQEINIDSDSTHARVVRLIGTGKRVLELGPAAGHMSRVLREQGCAIVGIELDVGMAERAAAFCERIVVGDIEQLDLARELGDDRFDVVVAADVLEHLKEPGALLGRLRSYLRDGGYVVASVPNVAHGSVRLALLTGAFPYGEVGLLDRTHLRFYVRDSLEQLFEDAGLAVRELVRQQLPIADSEVPYERTAIPSAVWELLATDPEALTYQFIVVASPMSPVEQDLVDRRIRQVAGRDATIRALKSSVWSLQAMLEKQTTWAQQASAEVARRDGIIRELQALLEEQVALGKGVIEEVAERDRLLQQLQATLEQQTAWAQQMSQDVTERDRIIRELQATLAEQTAWAQRASEEVAQRDAIIRDLQTQMETAAPPRRP